ncbi:MAG TPA: DnaJ domain-containing protein [Labilithrix sp.]|nr:DnaJ domain-containing protein [Labilithrix sp.]
MDGPALKQWLAALDSISYYELFRAAPNASYDELRAAFHAFAETFHPDGHLSRDPNEQAAIGRIYRRGTEAWRVLSDPTLRARYDDALANGIVRPENLIVEMEAGRSLAPPSGSGRLIDTVRSPGARPFVLRAEELLKKGDPKQAKIQLVMALHMDKGNAALEAFGKQVDEAIAAKADADKKS